MEPFTKLTGIVAPIDRSNVDTDAIIPKQFLKSVKRTGFGPNLFDAWRYLDKGEPDKTPEQRSINPDFVLNKSRYQDTKILLCRINFGCGSSREHAAWAVHGAGIRAMIAPSYGDIFFSNCTMNGLVPLTLSEDLIDGLFEEVEANSGYTLTVDLENLRVEKPDGTRLPFDFERSIRNRLLNGLDDIAVSLQSADAIRDYEARRAIGAPWLFPDR